MHQLRVGAERLSLGGRPKVAWPLVVLGLGAMALVVPTLAAVARLSWSTEQGAHGPLVLATGIWLLVREWREAPPQWCLGSATWSGVLLAGSFSLYILACVVGVIEAQGVALYIALLTIFYALFGFQTLRSFWFPLFYLGFIFPPPDTIVAAVTQPLKIWISQTAVDLLAAFGLPIANSGVTIQIAQYQLLVAAACAGLNSMISLTAICLFYVYMRHKANLRYATLLLLAILPVAIGANFVRVLLLILITYYFGDAAAQGFIHSFAGLTMFAIALLLIMALDALLKPLRYARGAA